MLGFEEPFELFLDSLPADVAAGTFAFARGFQVFEQYARRARDVRAEIGDVAFKRARSGRGPYLESRDGKSFTRLSIRVSAEDPARIFGAVVRSFFSPWGRGQRRSSREDGPRVSALRGWVPSGHKQNSSAVRPLRAFRRCRQRAERGSGFRLSLDRPVVRSVTGGKFEIVCHDDLSLLHGREFVANGDITVTSVAI